MTAIILIGDILVCGFLAGLVAWLLSREKTQKLQDTAALPLLDDEQTWQGNGVADSVRRKEEEQ